jgi:hypothetical protein
MIIDADKCLDGLLRLNESKGVLFKVRNDRHRRGSWQSTTTRFVAGSWCCLWPFQLTSPRARF